ncbi:MAG: ABC transporter permease [Halobacteriota archaeon]
MKSLDVASKGIRETARDRRGLALIVGFPIILIVLFSFAFSSGTYVSGGNIPHQIAVVNNDVGVLVTANDTTKYVNYGSNFTDVLENSIAENSTKHLFQLNNVSEDKANDLLVSRNLDALIIIPKNFSSAFATMVNNSTRTAITSSIGQQAIANSGSLASGNAASVNLPKAGNVSSTLLIQGDTSNINFATAQSSISAIFEHYKNGLIASTTSRAAPGTGNLMFANDVPVETLSINGTESFTRFDYMVPGLIVFALLLQVGAIASSLARDVETGLLDRLKLSNARAFDLLSGTFLTWTLISIGQIFLLIGAGIALGYHYQGGFDALGLAIIIGAIAGMASISLALIIASFSTRSMQALILGVMFATPFGFLAGAFLPLPRQVLGEFGGQTFQVYDILPWTHAVTALRSILTFGSGLTPDVAFETTWLIILTAILFVAGVVTYSLARLKTAK